MKTVRKNVTKSNKVTKVFALLRFGQEEYLNDLVKNGVLYLSSIEDIRKIEEREDKENYRNDPVEGAHNYRSSGPGTASYKHPNGMSGSINFLNLTYYDMPEIIYGNICSFYAITAESFLNCDFIPVDKRMVSFGSHFIFITNYEEFMKRVERAMDELKIHWYYGPVEYFNEADYDGKLHMFKKRSRYYFQNEFRIYIETENTESMKLNIGSIEDIALIAPSDTIDQLKMTLKIS